MMNDKVVEAEITSTRALRAARVLHGKSTREALRTVPLLYSLCGTAQSHAAALACEQALGVSAAPATAQAREMLVWLETARDHLWRILLDWPVFLDEEVDKTSVRELSGLLPAFRRALFGDGDPFQPGVETKPDDTALAGLLTGIERLLEQWVFGCPPQQWLEIGDAAALAAWSENSRTIAARLLLRVLQDGWQDLGTNDVDFLPAFDDARLHRRFTDPGVAQFIAQPTWAERCGETTPLARQQAHPLVRSLLRQPANGLLARLAARLVELAMIPAYLRQRAAELDKDGIKPAADNDHGANGVGLGQVEAARGRLVHRVAISNDRLNSYHILAPTEWNFHPRGVAAKGLAALGAGGEAVLRRKAALWINAVDPCVGYELRVR